MKIDGPNRTSAPIGNGGAPRADRPAAPAAAGAQDSVSLSAASTQIQALEAGISEASGFDAAKVEAIKLAISEGRFTVNAEAIADKLIASTRELLAKQQQG